MSINDMLIRNAKATCSCCAQCGRKLAPDAPVWREIILLGQGQPGRPCVHPGMRYALAPVCKRCRSLVSTTLFGPPQPCENCGRPVHQSAERGGHVVCCETCARAVRLTTARQRRSEVRGTRKCDTCGETFEPTRTDALFCSSACRQHAYRRRKTVTDTHITTGCVEVIGRNTFVTDGDAGTDCPLPISRNAEGKAPSGVQSEH